MAEIKQNFNKRFCSYVQEAQQLTTNLIVDGQVQPNTQISEFTTTLTVLDEPHKFSVVHQQDINQSNEVISNSKIQNKLPALYQNECVSQLWRYAMPILLISNILFFALASKDGASVGLQGQVFSLQTPYMQISMFQLLQSIRDMWNAKTYAIAILIVLWSWWWPYIKLFLMCISWFLNSKQMSYRTRERLLITLDMMGKWSLLDSFMLVMQIVAFHLQIGQSDANISMAVLVNPRAGFYQFVFATLLSLILTHVIVHFHRKSKEKEELRVPEMRALGFKKRTWRYVILAVLLCTAAFVVIGAAIPSFNFTFYGLAGALVGESEASKDYSIFSLGAQIPQKTGNADSFGIRCVQGIYFMFIVVIPLLFLSVLCVIWTIPLRLSLQKTLFRIAEILNAWSCIDVFVVCLLVCLLQIPQFSQYFIGSKCSPINDWLRVLDQFGLINLHGYYTCFEVKTFFLHGFWVFLCSALFYLVFGTIVLRISQAKLNVLIKQATACKQGDCVLSTTGQSQSSEINLQDDIVQKNITSVAMEDQKNPN